MRRLLKVESIEFHSEDLKLQCFFSLLFRYINIIIKISSNSPRLKSSIQQPLVSRHALQVLRRRNRASFGRYDRYSKANFQAQTQFVEKLTLTELVYGKIHFNGMWLVGWLRSVGRFNANKMIEFTNTDYPNEECN